MKIRPESHINRLEEAGGTTTPLNSSRVTILAKRHIPIIGSSDSLKTRADNQLPLKTTEKAHNTAKNLRLFTQRV